MFKKRSRLFAGVLAVLGLFTGLTQADQSEEEITTTTGTRTPKLLTETPVAVDIVSGEDIDRITIGTLEDALDFIPGVNFTRSVKDGYNIQMQGFDGDHVLVLVDGQRLVSPTGTSVNLAQISALNIERIEIVRGAASALYGSEAMGGVINIITKDGFEHMLRIAHELGEYEDNEVDELSQETSLSASTYYKNIAVQVYHQKINAPAFNILGGLTEDIEGEKQKTLSNIRLLYRKDKELSASYKYQVLNELIERSEGIFPSLGREYFYATDVEQSLHSGIFSYKNFELKSQLNIHEEISGLETTKRSISIDQFELDSQYIWQAVDAEWVGGVHYYADSLDQTNLVTGEKEVDDKSQSGIELFIQGDWQLSDAFELVGGVRAQNDDSYGSHSAFKLNSMYAFDLDSESKIKWRTNIGEGYRIPSIKEQWYIFDHSNLGYKVLGAYEADPDAELLPETSLSFGSSLEYIRELSKTRTFSTSLNVYQSKSKNFIDTVRNAELSEIENLNISVYSNIENVNISGFEFDAELNLKNQRYQLAYNYIDARNSDTNSRLASRPYHQLKANYRYTIPSLNLNLLTYMVYESGEAEAPDEILINNEYTTFDFILDHRINELFRWKVGVDNIFNEHALYDLNQGTEFDSRPTRGRYLFLSLELKLSP